MNTEKTIDFIDDSVDVGKEPLQIDDPDFKLLYNQIIEEYKQK